MLCPYCKEKIKNWAEKCKHCQWDFTTEEGKKKLKEANKTSTATWILTAIIGFIIISGIIGSQSDTTNTSTASAPRNWFESDCLSSWDGSFKGFNDSFKKKLKGPSSYEHVETKYSNNTDGTHTVLVSYRAKNWFWAKDLWAVSFKADNSCNIIGDVSSSTFFIHLFPNSIML